MPRYGASSRPPRPCPTVSPSTSTPPPPSAPTQPISAPRSVALSVKPELGTPVPDTLLRGYLDDVDGVRVIYYVTALRTITIVAYVEA